MLDLGTGTGLLAIGAAKLWKRPVLASDIDPVAVEVARENAVANDSGSLIRAVVADGLANPVLSRGAPYDLLIANILAGPLTQLAPSIQRALAPGAMLVLSGLLTNQEKLVTSFYRRSQVPRRAPHGALERAGAGKAALSFRLDVMAYSSATLRPYGQALSDL